ncbi:hypothetical protein, partial [Pseudomonas syringae group genomosp. 3]|uniref:hypothetical protein n=1 Tax=Pseudomonas syringae group genomosp. 3 TaxID=251701 RepID=UPI001F224619
LGERCWGILPNQETFFRVSLSTLNVGFMERLHNFVLFDKRIEKSRADRAEVCIGADRYSRRG